MALKGKPFAKLFGILKTVAPTLLAASGSPLAPLAMNIAKKVMGKEGMSDTELEDAVAVAAGTTEGLAQLRTIEAELQKVELEQEFKFAELEVDDRKDARARQIAIRDNAPSIVLYLTTFGFFGTLAFLLSQGMPQDAGTKEVILIMIGSLGAAWGACVTYFVGSSAGSRAKNDLLTTGKE
jgi:hypothetical protein